MFVITFPCSITELNFSQAAFQNLARIKPPCTYRIVVNKIPWNGAYVLIQQVGFKELARSSLTCVALRL